MFSVIKKELKVLFSKKISLIILLVYPLLLVYLLGVGFSGNNINFNVGISQIEDINSMQLTESFSAFGVTPIFYALDQNRSLGEKIGSAFLDNVFLATPIFVSVTSLDNNTYGAKIYSENLDFFVGKTGVQLTENALMYLSNRISLEKITIMTNEIKNLRVILIDQKQKLTDYSIMLDDTNQKLVSIKEKLNSVDFLEIKSTILAKQNDLNNVSAQLEILKQDKNVLETAYTSNKTLIDTLDIIYGDLSSLNISLNTLKTQAALLSLALAQLPNDFNGFDINSFLTTINLTSNDLNSVLVAIQDANTSANKSSLGLGKFVNDFNATFNLIENDVNDTNATLITLNTKINEIESDFNYANTVIDDSLIKQAQIKKDLNSSIVLMNSIIEQLSPDKFDPVSIAKPITIEKESRYGFFESKDIAIIFGIVLVLLFNAILLVSMSGVKDKTNGIDVREKLAPRNRFWFFLGRFFAQSIVGILTSIVMFVFAIIVFGFPLQNIGFVLLNLILAIFAFVSIGLFISIFVDSESIAILLSLLIVMPMLFLSGLILPTYFMPSVLSAIANVLPLTLGKDALINAIVGKSSLFSSIILLGYTIVFLTLVYLFRKR